MLQSRATLTPVVSVATLTPVVSVLPLRILLLSFIVSGEKFWELLTYFTYYDCNVYLLVTNVFLMIFPAWSHLLVLQPDHRSNGRRDIASVKYTASSVCNSVCFFFLRIKKNHILKVENEIKQDMKPHHMKVIQMKAYIRYK